MTLKKPALLLIISLCLSLSTTSGNATEILITNNDDGSVTVGSDCEKGLDLCDQALSDCDKALKEQQLATAKLKEVAAAKDAQINDLERHDKIIYRQPLPWLLLGAAISLLNPAIGIPLIAVGVAREL